MKPQMFNSIRHFVLLLMMAPAMAFAQPSAPEPCPSATPDLSDFASLASLSELSSLADLGELKELAQLGQDLQDMDWTDASMVANDVEKRKNFEKTYKVSSSDMLSIDNKFGKVHVNTWDRNEIQVKVEMISRAGSEQRAQEMLNRINISESRAGRNIILKTVMESMRMNGSGNRSFEINYTVSMPENNPLTIKNTFGDVYLAALKGKTDIVVNYGVLKAERLNNDANAIKLLHCQGRMSHISYLNRGLLDIAYSSLIVDGVNVVQGNSRYSDISIGNVKEVLNLGIKYGSFKVDRVSKGIREINLDSGYTPILLNFEDNSAFSFNVKVQYADFMFDKSNVNITSFERDITSAEYIGHYGSATPRGTVSIISKYDDVRFTK